MVWRGIKNWASGKTSLKNRQTMKISLIKYTSVSLYLWGCSFHGHNEDCTMIYFGNSSITKTCLYNFDPLKPHFYIVKLGFTGVYIIFLISAQKHRLWVLVRTASPRQF